MLPHYRWATTESETFIYHFHDREELKYTHIQKRDAFLLPPFSLLNISYTIKERRLFISFFTLYHTHRERILSSEYIKEMMIHYYVRLLSYRLNMRKTWIYICRVDAVMRLDWHWEEGFSFIWQYTYYYIIFFMPFQHLDKRDIIRFSLLMLSYTWQYCLNATTRL